MKTVTVNANELTGKALDWAVGVAVKVAASPVMVTKIVRNGIWSPATNWAQLGPLLDACGVRLSPLTCLHEPGGVWTAQIWTQRKIYIADGREPLMAACRAIVAAKLGQTVDVPEVLV